MTGSHWVRVLHICPYMHPSAGGPPVVVERLCSLTPSEGWDATVITTSLYCEDDGENLRNSLRQHIDVKVLPIRRPRILKQACGAVDAIDKAVRLADVVHLHTLWHPLNAITRKACLRHCRKYALMPHGMLDPYSLRQKRWRKTIYLAAVERSNLQIMWDDRERVADDMIDGVAPVFVDEPGVEGLRLERGNRGRKAQFPGVI